MDVADPLVERPAWPDAKDDPYENWVLSLGGNRDEADTLERLYLWPVEDPELDATLLEVDDVGLRFSR